MKPTERAFTLRDGRRARIRPLRASDAAEMLRVERALHADGRGMVRSLGQTSADVDSEASRIAPWVAVTEAETGSIAVVAEVLEPTPELAGSATLDRLLPALLRHVGVAAVGIAPAHQGLGAGRALMQALIAHARAIGLHRLELYVRTDNPRAIALYRSLGFEHEGTRRHFVKLADGTHVDDYVMALLI
jgi:putative acetyltransferase